MKRRRLLPLASFVTLCATFAFVALPVIGQQPASEDPPLPTAVPVINIDAPENNVFLLGAPDLLGDATRGTEAGGILRNDFRLMPGYRVIDTREIRHDLAAEGLTLQPARWASLNANGVIKGELRGTPDRMHAEMRFFMMARGGAPAFSKAYDGPATDMRKWMHDFANEVLRTITGTAGVFGTKLTYAYRQGPGRKDICTADMDGHAARRISGGQGVSMLPAWADDGSIWFSRLTSTGMFITHQNASDRPVITGNGLNMGPSICRDRIYFTSSRDANSEIYSARLDGTQVRRLTNHPGIDVSPSCGPTGKIAFVSTRHGGPQIFVMNEDGTGVQRVTYRGNHNQTPAWCPIGGQNLLAFTGRDVTLDIFTVNIATREYTRLTQAQGANKDPAFSPDCRLLAFATDRRSGPGIYLASPQGFNQTRVLRGEQLETVRWAR